MRPATYRPTWRVGITTEAWQSGLMRAIDTRLMVEVIRGFESLRLPETGRAGGDRCRCRCIRDTGAFAKARSASTAF